MKLFRLSRASTVSTFGLLLVLAGCSAQAGVAAADTTTDQAVAASTTTAAADAQNAQRGPRMQHGPRPGGPDFLLVAALHEPTVNLTAAQRSTIEGALAANAPKERVKPAFDATRAKALATAVRANTVDALKLDAPAGAPTKADFEAHLAASAKAIDTLHATLTADQRKALVAAIQAHEAGKGDGGERRGPPPGAKEGERGPRFGGPGPIGHLTQGLDLTTEQQAALRTKLEADRPKAEDIATMKATHEAFRTEMQARLATFANDTFDAKAFVAPPAGMLDMHNAQKAHVDPMTRELAALTSVLTPAQREKLAARIEQGPPARAE